MPGEELPITWPALVGVVGFSPQTGTRSPSLLLGQWGAEGPGLVQTWIESDMEAGQLRLSLLSLEPLIAVPLAIAAGELDGFQPEGRNAADVVALVAGFEPGSWLVQVVLGFDGSDAQLTGMLQLGSSQSTPRLWTADFTGNGQDDIAIMRDIQDPPGSEVAVEIFSMGSQGQ